MKGYHNLSPDIWDKIFPDWFTKFSDGCIASNWYKFIHLLLPVNSEIHKMGNSSNIPCPRSSKLGVQISSKLSTNWEY